MKAMPEWLGSTVKRVGQDFYGVDTSSYGMGGSIPFLSELDKMYPSAVIMAIGLIGPKANAHGPDEAINLPFAKKLTCSLSHLISEVGNKE